MAGDLTIAVVAKAPVAGVAKTRLTPPCTPAQAAALARDMLADTLSAVARTPARRRVLALDGAMGALDGGTPDGFDVVRQVDGTLDVRLAGVLAEVDGPMLLIGSDTPQVTPDLLRCDLGDCTALLGPAEDGGFWALAMAEPHPDVVRGVPMSVPHTYREQRRRLLAAGHRLGVLPPLRDVDTWHDALAVAALAPATRFGRAMARLSSPAASDGPRPVP